MERPLRGALGGTVSADPVAKGLKWRRLTTKWLLPAFLFVVMASLGAWIFSGVAPWQQVGEVAYKQQEYREELRAREQREQLVERHIRLGNLFLSRGQLQAAGQEFTSALELDPNKLSAQFGKFKSEVFEPIEQGGYAPEVLKSRMEFALAENPEDAHIHAYLGEVYLTLDPVKSEILFRKAIALDPGVSTAYVGLGRVFDMRNMADSSILYYEKAVSYSEWNQTGLLHLGHQYLRRGENGKALEKFDRLLGLDGRNLPAHYYRVLSLMRANRWDDAAAALGQILVLAEQKEVMSQAKNRGEWTFHHENRMTVLTTAMEKIFYARALAGAASHMLGKQPESREQLHGALSMGLEPGRKNELLALAAYDMGQSCSAEASCIRKVTEFRSRYALR